MATIFTSYADGPALVLRKYYTAKDINATSGSRNSAAFNLVAGDIVQLDAYDHEGNGVGQTVAIPTTGQKTRLFVVTQVSNEVNQGENPNAVVSATNVRKGGWIDVTPCGIVDAVADGSGTAIAFGDLLKLSIPGSGGRVELVTGEADTAIDTPAELRLYVGRSLNTSSYTTASSNTSPSTIKIEFGGAFQFGM